MKCSVASLRDEHCGSRWFETRCEISSPHLPSVFVSCAVPRSVGRGRPQRQEGGPSSERVRGRGKRQGEAEGEGQRGEWEGLWTVLLGHQWDQRLHSHLEVHELWHLHRFGTRPGSLPTTADLPAPQELQRRLAHFSPVSSLFCTVEERWASFSVSYILGSCC